MWGPDRHHGPSQAMSHIDAAISALSHHRHLDQRDQDALVSMLEMARDTTQTPAMVNGSMASLASLLPTWEHAPCTRRSMLSRSSTSRAS